MHKVLNPLLLFLLPSSLVAQTICDYKCSPSGGCDVEYVGPNREGPKKGSCFPELFGGSCHGTPPECEKCNKVKTCVKTEGPSIKNDREEADNNIPGSDCSYSCQSGGGCEVLYTGQIPTGEVVSTKGACFPPKFGSVCFGTPPFCEPCNKVTECGGGSIPVTPPSLPEGPDCEYRCRDDGACEVEYIGERRSGDKKGSCFGGRCFGTPPECQDCSKLTNCGAGTQDYQTQDDTEDCEDYDFPIDARVGGKQRNVQKSRSKCGSGTQDYQTQDDTDDYGDYDFGIDPRIGGKQKNVQKPRTGVEIRSGMK